MMKPKIDLHYELLATAFRLRDIPEFLTLGREYMNRLKLERKMKQERKGNARFFEYLKTIDRKEKQENDRRLEQLIEKHFEEGGNPISNEID